MKRRYRLAFGGPVFAALLLSACAPDIVFVSDRYLAEVVVDDAFDERVRNLSHQFDRRIAVSVVTEASGFVPSESADCYFFAPLLRDIGLSYAEAHPARVFVFGPAIDEAPANLGRVRFDRIAAFESAGEAAARLAVSEEASGLVGMILLADTDTRRAERDAFLTGLSSADGDVDVRSRIYPRQPRREDLRTDVRSMITRGVNVLLIAVGGQNGFALDLLAGQDVSVITEDAGETGGFETQIVFSIERSMIAALESITRSCVQGTTETVIVDAELKNLRVTDVNE